jgi:hypothetical protein
MTEELHNIVHHRAGKTRVLCGDALELLEEIAIQRRFTFASVAE